MKLRNNKGFTGIDIAVSVVIIFIFISIVSMLVYRVNSKSREIELRGNATYLAINEIEQLKNNGYNLYGTRSQKNGDSIVCENEEIPGEEGFYRTIEIIDYTDLEGNEDKIPNIVKKVTVKISYMFNAKEQTVELSTVITKEN